DGHPVLERANATQSVKLGSREVRGVVASGRRGGRCGQRAIARQRGLGRSVPLGQRALLRRAATRQIIQAIRRESRGMLSHMLPSVPERELPVIYYQENTGEASTCTRWAKPCAGNVSRSHWLCRNCGAP